jgi:hypothetical protein
MYNFLPKQKKQHIEYVWHVSSTRSKIIFNKPKEICEVWRAKHLMKVTIYLLQLA